MLKVFIGGLDRLRSTDNLSAPHRPVSMLTVYKEKIEKAIYKERNCDNIIVRKLVFMESSALVNLCLRLSFG